MCTVTQEIDPVNITTTYVKDCSNPIPLQIFGKGFEYKFLGLIPTNRHLIVAPEGEAKLMLFGADGNGRDIYSRTLYGAPRLVDHRRLSGSRSPRSWGRSWAPGPAMPVAGPTTSSSASSRSSSPSRRCRSGRRWRRCFRQDITVTQRFFLMSLILSLLAVDRTGAPASRQGDGLRRVRLRLRRQVSGGQGSSDHHHSPAAQLGQPHRGGGHAGHPRAQSSPRRRCRSSGSGCRAGDQLGRALEGRPSASTSSSSSHGSDLPAVFVIVAITCFQLVGDGVRDAVDPYS